MSDQSGASPSSSRSIRGNTNGEYTGSHSAVGGNATKVVGGATANAIPFKDLSTDEKLDTLFNMILRMSHVNRMDSKDPFRVEHTFTYEEAAILCHRAPRTIKNIVSKHQIPHRIVRGPGSFRTHIALLSADSLARIRKLTLGY